MAKTPTTAGLKAQIKKLENQLKSKSAKREASFVDMTPVTIGLEDVLLILESIKTSKIPT